MMFAVIFLSVMNNHLYSIFWNRGKHLWEDYWSITRMTHWPMSQSLC